MPAGGGSGEGGLAARGYNGPAQPGGNYGGTNVVGTGGGFLGDRSAINQAVLNAQQKNPSTYSGNQSVTYTYTVDPITGKKTKVILARNGVPVPQPKPTIPGVNFPPEQDQPAGAENPDDSYSNPGSPSYGSPIDYGGSVQPGWSPGTGYPGRPDPSGNIPGSAQRSAMAAPAGDMAAMSMMAAPEGPLVSPGPIGPGGQPMGNRPPPFQWGARDLALRHGMEQMLRQRQMMQQPRMRPNRPMRDGRNEEARRILRAAARMGGRR